MLLFKVYVLFVGLIVFCFRVKELFLFSVRVEIFVNLCFEGRC